MGGIVDPERGALIYRKTTEVKTVDPDVDSDFTTKKIKTVTSESSWLGQAGREGEKAALQPTEVKPWHDEEVESNPLYSATEYTNDFHNPLYSRQTGAEPGGTMADSVDMADDIPLVPLSRASRGRPESGRAIVAGGQEYTDYLSAQPGLDNADTLF